MNIGKYKIGADRTLPWRVGRIPHPLYYIRWGFQVGPLFIERWTI